MSLLPVSLPDWATAFVFAVGWALLYFLGQGLCIGLVVAALLRGLRDRSADLRYATACLGLLLMMCCTIAMTVWGLTSGRNGAGIAIGRPGTAFSLADTQNRIGGASDGAVTPNGFDGSSSLSIFGLPADPDGFESIGTQPKVGIESKLQGGWREPVERWLPALVTGWLAGVAVLTLRLIKGLAEVRGLTASGLLGVTDELRSLIEALEKRSGLRRPVRWFLSLRVEVPTVAGWLRPTILIPAKCWSRLAVEQVEALLAHEIAHIRRHDYLVNICQVSVETLLFFHPAVWWVSKRIRVERENCCDDLAATICGGDRLLVARALFALEEERSARILLVAANGGSLRERIRRLVAPRSVATCPAEAGWTGVSIGVATIGLVSTAWLVGTSHARVDEPARAGRPVALASLLEQAGQPAERTTERLVHGEAVVTQVQARPELLSSGSSALVPEGEAVVTKSQAQPPASPLGQNKSVKEPGQSPRGDIPEGLELMTPQADHAIKNGLVWLAQAQNADGSYGSGTYRGDIAVTSVAALAFLASGSSPRRGPYGAQVDKALLNVMNSAAPSGFLSGRSASTHGPMYSHGFATLFLAEAYAITHRPEIREKLEKAVGLIIACQNDEGGWRYQPVKKDADISVTICQINALRAARNAGLDVPQATIDAYIRYVKKSQYADGGFRYMVQGGASAFPRSAGGVLALESAGDRDSKEVRDGVAYLRGFVAGIKLGSRYSHYFYGHYYAAQAMWLRGGEDWAQWYPAIRDELLKRQSTHGFWADSICNEYGTAMALVVLQIPNNYLPAFQR